MENWKLLLAGIRNALSDLAKKTFNVNGSVEVSNLPGVQRVEIINPQEPTEKVEVSNLVDYKEELNKIIGELIKVPKDIKTADYTPIIDALKEVVRTLEDDKTDYSPIIQAIESAVKELKVEYPEFDYSEIINTIKGIQQFNLSNYLYNGELPVIINDKQIKKLVDAFGKKAGQIIATSTSGADTSKLATEVTLQTVADTVGTVGSAIPTKGINILVKQQASDAHSSVDEGDGVSLSVTDFDELRTRDQRSIDLANCNVYTDYTAISNDTTGIANSTNHVFGVGAITFDKVNGAANTVYGGVYKTFTAINVAEIFEAGGFVGCSAYLPSLTNVINVFVRIGTDTTNYNTWAWPVADLVAGSWMNLRKAASLPDYSRSAGNGWNTGAVSYVAFGVEFNAEANTLSGIIFDHVHLVGGRVTATDLSTSITSTVNTPNINMQRIGSGAGTAVDTSAGNYSAGTQRTVSATNDPNLSAIKTAIEILDNVVSGNEAQVDIVAALPAGTNTIGAVKSVPSDIDINGSNANHADKYYTNAGAVTDGIVWSPAAGKRWHILTLYINVSAAATVTLEDDLAAGDNVRWKGELAANSGVVLTYDKEHPFCSGEDAADLLITTTAGNVYVQAVGYEV